MVDLARLAQLKRLLNDGTLIREEFEALKQKELQADGTDRGSVRPRVRLCLGTLRLAPPAPVIVGRSHSSAHVCTYIYI